MKYKLIKQFPGIQFNVGDIYEFDYYTPEKYPDFFEPIVEKKTYETLKKLDPIFFIHTKGVINIYPYELGDCKSEVFLTREEAEDEHKRREWAVRKDKFVPEQGEKIFYIGWDRIGLHNKFYSEKFWKESYLLSLIVNFGLAFRTEEELKNAIDNHDLIRLFYTIR